MKYYCGSCFDNFDILTKVDKYVGANDDIFVCPKCGKQTWAAYDEEELPEIIDAIIEEAKEEYLATKKHFEGIKEKINAV